MNNYTDDFSRCKDCAFYYLNKRRHTKKELIEKLVKREYSPEVANEVADYLEDAKYIDDADYARRYMLDAVRIKKHGMARIKRDLALKGINSAVVDAVAEDFEIRTENVLLDLIESKAVNLDFNDEKQLNKLYGFLLRRGFKYCEIKDALASKKENF